MVVLRRKTSPKKMSLDGKINDTSVQKKNTKKTVSGKGKNEEKKTSPLMKKTLKKSVKSKEKIKKPTNSLLVNKVSDDSIPKLVKIEKSDVQKPVEKPPVLKKGVKKDASLEKKSTKKRKLNEVVNDSVQKKKTTVDLSNIVIGEKPKRVKTNNLISLKRYDTKIEEISNKYNIPIDIVEDGTTNIIKLVENNPKIRSTLFAEKFPIFLQLNVIKIPQGKKILRLDLEHSLVEPDDDICLILPDIKGIKNKEHEQHIDRYEEILKKKDITGIKKIMTLHELKTEYDTFELKRGLVELYDLFLVDGKISGRVVRMLGKIFYKKRKLPTPIKFDSIKLNDMLENAKKKTLFQVHSNGDSFMVQIGHSKMTERELVENVFTAINNLDKKFPGGFKNMKSINIFAHRGSSIPIHVSLVDPNTVKRPKIWRVKPKLSKDVEGELSTKLNQVVKVTPTGNVIVTNVQDKD